MVASAAAHRRIVLVLTARSWATSSTVMYAAALGASMLALSDAAHQSQPIGANGGRITAGAAVGSRLSWVAALSLRRLSSRDRYARLARGPDPHARHLRAHHLCHHPLNIVACGKLRHYFEQRTA